MRLFPELNADHSINGDRPTDYADVKSSYECCVCKEEFPPSGVFNTCMSYDDRGLFIALPDGEMIATVCDICVYVASVHRGRRMIAEMEKTARGRARLAEIRAEAASKQPAHK